MIRQWGAVLMAAAGQTVGTDVGAPAAVVATRTSDTVRQNQTITFARSAARGVEGIRATARGPIDGFGTARVLSFAADDRTGAFRGVWELTFPAGTVRYAFSGAARQPTSSAELLAARGVLALPSGAALAVRSAPGRALVAGDFILGGGTGRFAGTTGHGSFRGWTMTRTVELAS